MDYSQQPPMYLFNFDALYFEKKMYAYLTFKAVTDDYWVTLPKILTTIADNVVCKFLLMCLIAGSCKKAELFLSSKGIIVPLRP